MKSAREMFEELGYEETTLKDHTIEYSLKDYDEFNGYFISCKIIFYKRHKRIEIRGLIDEKELQAINKQVEELKWKVEE